MSGCPAKPNQRRPTPRPRRWSRTPWDVSVVKSLKVKGGGAIKIGTKVTNIRLLEDPVDGHDIDAKVPGAGQMYLKSSVVKKL